MLCLIQGLRYGGGPTHFCDRTGAGGQKVFEKWRNSAAMARQLIAMMIFLKSDGLRVGVMEKEKVAAQVGATALEIAEKCAISAAGVAALMVAGVMPAEASVAPQAIIQAATPVTAPPDEGAILLNIVTRDPATGEMIAGHHSHASHASHESHASHYSSRPY